jgi:predicted DNA-binding transcriptional regulator AlpA
MTLLTQREAALVLRLSERTLERMRCTGRDAPPFIRCGRRSIRYRQSDLEKWIAGRVVYPSPRQPPRLGSSFLS